MVFREVDVVEVREMLRLWVRGHGYKAIARLTQIDRKTVRRYVEAAVRAGLTLGGGETQLADELVGEVIEAVRPARPGGHGHAWEHLASHRQFVEERLKTGLTLTKIASQLYRHTGVVVPYRALHRFCAASSATAPAGRRRCGWTTPSRGRSCRWTSGGWGSSAIPPPGAAASSTR